MKKLVIYLFCLGIPLFSLSSCDEDATNNVTPKENQDIVELAIDNGFNLLAQALIKTDLVDDLKTDGPFTVFAPTDDAFKSLLNTIGQSNINDVPVSVLKEILLYHVVGAKVKSSDISNGDVSTLQGSDVTLSTTNGITVNGTNVVAPFDVEASNGIIHTVDAVLAPASIARFVNTVLEPAFFNESFTTLVEAVVKADLVETLLNTPNLTIFAPDNSAFSRAGIIVSEVDKATLSSVLTYHVVGSKVLSSQIPREAGTVNGAKLYFSLIPQGNFINGSTEIIAVDIESGSGVVHVIEEVLLPPVGNLVETAIALSESGEFTSLVAALLRTANEGSPEQNLISVLSGTGPFSVFAPTNAAFQALLDSNSDWNSLNDIPLSTLIAVLTYHVVPARAYDKDLAGALDINNELPTAQGTNIKVDLASLTINENSQIVAVNTNATNGVIHVINSVLLP
jgi:uncharacterized surface protein with fasciclin (FAS1) repeats